ncbi:pectin lyase-like protein [Lindgomyces ingoldianus]|uniref:Pectin lyase-like protein n=1 Tax=Lindgomyces ingoldianus TaxID=673940 RepID=A0ACB6QM84_9PLEO|nr:pectin lyase-like protein [Lindgomyces ingoldianus]KAF2468011.1 pectin lyase-like protein [Lindgomyces ingoldianus]
MRFSQFLLGAAAVLPTLVVGQLSGKVGPLTSHATKTSKKTCNVLDYGAKADKTTDVGPPLASAHAACKSGGTVVIPSGEYAMNTWVSLTGGSAWALQLDGVIYRTGTAGGNMIFVGSTSDFELFSSTGKGAVQGNGYVLHAQGSRTGARILRLNKVTNFSVHDVVLVDAPAFHFSMDTCTNGEVYNMAIRGGDWGGLDGIDVWSNNIWIHDVMVTNKDECVTVKSPSKNILIENIYCNWSGGCALGSLGANTAISLVHYKNIYTWSSNQMMMIKSNGGSGYVEDTVFENFIGRGNAYSLDIDQYWSSMSAVDGSGVKLTNLTFKNWKGTEANGASRGPIKVMCADGAPCTDITITDFSMWTESGSKQWYSCRSAYGSGFCLKSGSGASYAATTSTVSAAPAGYTAATMKDDLKTAFGTTLSIPIPTIPTTYYPGATPYSKIAGT